MFKRSFIRSSILGAITVFAMNACAVVRASDDTKSADDLRGRLLQLESAPLTKSSEYSTGGVLVREILRQALWMAAHDELGLRTRDAALRETIDPALSAPFVATVEIENRKHVILKVGRRSGDEIKPLFSEQIEMAARGFPDYAKLVRRCEELARGEFVELLKKEGFRPAASAGDAPARVGMDTDYRQWRMDFVSQLSALREIHAAERTGRRSDESLAALTRGYANLGHLTDFMCNLSNKVFKARSLLYAQRMTTAKDASTFARWHQAYAWALCGRSYEALWAIKHARGEVDAGASSEDAPKEPGKAEAASVGEDVAPEWGEIIDAYCHSDVDRLTKIAKETNRWDELSMMLAFHAVEYLVESNLPDVVGHDVVEKMPGCFRVADAYTDCVGVRRGHSASTEPMVHLIEELPSQLARVRDLPGKAAGLATAMQGADASEPLAALGDVVPKLVGELVRQGALSKDADEPSWECLGRMIEETVYAQVQRRASFLKYWLAVPAGDFVNAAKPLYKDHPLAVLMTAYGLDDANDAAAYSELVKDLSIPNADCAMLRFNRLTGGAWQSVVLKVPAYKSSYHQIWRNHDAIRGDVGRILRIDSENTKTDWAKWLLYASPYDPAAMVRLIDKEWDAYSGNVDDWLKATGELSPILLALGDHAYAVGKSDEAAGWYGKAVVKEPSKTAYEGLAKCQLQDNDLDGYVATMRKFIKYGQDFGLDHAAASRNAAHTLMLRRAPERALPFAEESAGSYSEWGLGCAAACYEALGRFDDAELTLRRCGDRYPHATMDWYRFCVRTGKGDKAAALRAAREFIAQNKDAKSASIQCQIAIFHMLEGNIDDAVSAWQRSCEFTEDTWYHANLIAAAQLAGKSDIRDAAIERVNELRFVARKADVLPSYSDMVIQEFRNALKVGGKFPLDYVESLLSGAGPTQRMELLCFAAECLEGVGDTATADKLLTRVARMPYVQNWTASYARETLRKRGKSVPPVKRPIYFSD